MQGDARMSFAIGIIYFRYSPAYLKSHISMYDKISAIYIEQSKTDLFHLQY